MRNTVVIIPLLTQAEGMTKFRLTEGSMCAQYVLATRGLNKYCRWSATRKKMYLVRSCYLSHFVFN